MQSAIAVKQQLRSGRAIKFHLRVIELTIVVVRGRNAFDEEKYFATAVSEHLIEIQKVNIVCQGFLPLAALVLGKAVWTCRFFFDRTIEQRIKSECVRCYRSHDRFQHTLALLTSLPVTE